MSIITNLYTKHLNRQVEYYWNIYHFDMTPGHQSHNNEADAFKHCYFQAELTLWLGENFAKKIGDTHEAKPDNPENEKKMDLHNNIIGREIGKEIKRDKFWFISNWQDKIAEKIIDAMGKGLLITSAKGNK